MSCVAVVGSLSVPLAYAPCPPVDLSTPSFLRFFPLPVLDALRPVFLATFLALCAPRCGVSYPPLRTSDTVAVRFARISFPFLSPTSGGFLALGCYAQVYDDGRQLTLDDLSPGNVEFRLLILYFSDYLKLVRYLDAMVLQDFQHT